MSRLFSGTKWDRPPTCQRCGKLESECDCPPPQPPQSVRLAPETQTAKITLEKRANGKIVTVIANLDSAGNDLSALAATLKTKCGAGGTVKDGQIELQGDHLTGAEAVLRSMGYKTQGPRK